MVSRASPLYSSDIGRGTPVCPAHVQQGVDLLYGADVQGKQDRHLDGHHGKVGAGSLVSSC